MSTLQSFLPRLPQSSPLPERQADLQAAHGLVTFHSLACTSELLEIRCRFVQVPNIVVRPPKERMEDSATFQRLGMRPRLSEV